MWCAPSRLSVDIAEAWSASAGSDLIVTEAVRPTPPRRSYKLGVAKIIEVCLLGVKAVIGAQQSIRRPIQFEQRLDLRINDVPGEVLRLCGWTRKH